MLESIREIGLFMIAAQAVIHFAPGSQYEKYVKLISSVIILFLFIRPFLSMQGEWEQEWQTKMDQMMQEYEAEDLWQDAGRRADDMAVKQLEEEIRTRLNSAVAEEIYCVDSVSLIFKKDSSTNTGREENGPQFQKVQVVMSQKGQERIAPVLIEDIVIGEENGQEDTEMSLRYRKIFAEILGIEPDSVEVTCVGGW